MKKTIIIPFPLQDKANIKHVSEIRGISSANFIQGIVEKRSEEMHIPIIKDNTQNPKL
jgi:hypothetical protein